jgi:PAS domain S-box-containing protein
LKKTSALGRSWRQAEIAAGAVLGALGVFLQVRFAGIPSAETRFIGIALVFAAAGVGCFALAGRPRAASFLGATLSGAAVTLSVQWGDVVGYSLAGISILYGSAIIAVIRYSQRLVLASAEAEREIRKQNEIIALALNDFSEGASDWLWETDADGNVTYASRGLAKGVGLPAQDLLGRPFASLFQIDVGGAGWDRLCLAMSARQAIECAVELPFAHTRMWWQVTSRPVRTANGQFTGFMGVAHNITAERQARSKLSEEKDAAIRDNARKSRFLAMMSHELRTPLNAIVGFAELLLSPSATNIAEPQRREHLQTILDSSSHLQSLIIDMLDVTRMEKGKLQLIEQEVDAAEIAEVAVKMCRDAAEKSDTTIIASVIEGIELRCDATRTRQILINLVTNAVKFSPSGGIVKVSFEKSQDGGLAISVRDEGIGIRSEDMERIFEPFVQVDEGQARQFGGMGLGLAIARQIALLHGGDVTIASAPGAGTTARFVLPAARVAWSSGESSDFIRAA